MNRPAPTSEIIDAVRKHPSHRVKVAAADIDGVLRGKYVRKKKFLSALEGGFGFCDVVFGWDCNDACYDNAAYTGWHSGYPDANATIDLTTYRQVPWDDNVPFFLADFVDGAGAPLAVCPRQALKRIIGLVEQAGYRPSFGMEFEFFNYLETPQSAADKGYQGMTPSSPGMFGYSVLRSTLQQPYFQAVMDKMEAFGVPLEGFHTETGPGVMEAAILFCDALEAADRGVLFKTGLKEIGYQHGVMSTFMAKVSPDMPGNSGHMHQSLWSPDGETNLFHDAAAPDKMSKLFRHYIAGQMQLLPEFLAFFAPTVNSYKRLVEGHWAPTRVTWAIDNRTTALRALPGSPRGSRLETRVPGADVNPYVGIAAALAAGYWGVVNELELTAAPVVGNGYTAPNAERLPSNLLQAAERLEASAVARELFGDGFVDHFVSSRKWEWRQFQAAVTDWERKRYFEIV